VRLGFFFARVWEGGGEGGRERERKGREFYWVCLVLRDRCGVSFTFSHPATCSRPEEQRPRVHAVSIS